MNATDLDRQHTQQVTSRRNQAVALARLLDMGMTIVNEPVQAQPGCHDCEWHVVSSTMLNDDGGTASAILHWATEGYIGDPKDCLLYPVTD